MSDDARHRFEAAARIFLTVKDLDDAARAEALARECEGAAELRAAVEDLLRGASAPSPFQRLADDLHGTGARSCTDVETTIGPYRLLEKIGEGGFGSVHRAEQQQPMRRFVALKVLKPGMDTAQVIARFEAERQALAMMDHPNITRVLDAGATPQGRPFFVMDLVRGVPITEYCRTHRLSPRACVELFLPVCHAIQHAHQKGIVHRDLKPSNVLVTLLDGKPVPKVIDFGIAKALHGRLTDRTLFTEFRQFIGTPAYMSPEQAEMSGLDIDTRSDLYSLGVLLYELLTGSTPIDKAKLAAMPHAELQRVIREEEPQTPSRRVVTNGKVRTTQLPDPRAIADAVRRSRQLRGDLDWIVLRCLEKDRTRRYSSADALAMDLGRYLDDEPVEASPPSTLYRLAKFARRHRGVAAAVLGIVCTLIVGASIAGYGLVEASAERDRAMAEMKRANAAEASAMSQARRAKTVVDLIASMFAQADPSRSGAVDVPVRRLLDDFAQLHASALADQPEVLSTLHRVMATAYRGIGDVESAHRFATSAVDELRRLAPQGSCDLAAALGGLAELDARRGDRDLALRRIEDGERMSAASCADDAPERIQFLAAYADVLSAVGRRGDALDRITRAVDAARRGGAHGIALGDVLMARANVLLALDRVVEAQADADAAHAAYRTVFDERHPRVLSSIELQATVRAEAGELEPALALLRDVLDARIAVLGDAHPNVARTRCNLGFVLQTLRRFDEALLQHQAALTVLETAWGDGHPDAIRLRGSIGADLAALGRVEEGLTWLRDTHRIATAKLGPDAIETIQIEANLAIACLRHGDDAAAEPLFEHAIEVRRRDHGETSIALAVHLANLSAVRMHLGRLDEAQRGILDAIAMIQAVAGDDHIMAGRFRLNAAEIALRRGDRAAAEEQARAALTTLERYGDAAAVERDMAQHLLEQAVAHG
jgi:serine/threonine protein kinase/tetratricopeptide (TPR) repeat protein